MDIKTAITFFGLGLCEGAILLDWYRDKQALKTVKRKR